MSKTSGRKVELRAEKKNKKREKLLSPFPSTFFYRVFGRFSAWGAQKHHKKSF
jgi:hypothetical protein